MENLRKCRKLKHVTQEELASALGCCRATLIDIEKGRIDPTNEMVKTTSRILDVSPIELYGIDILKYRPTSKVEVDEIIEILKLYKQSLDSNN